ncbi:hypothetical protein HYQ45_015932 [Verticillium longisporum]|uniref:Uncharacterized protein n=1 Tax=Verticillium longisporum TaxID=100787 RepID=A0A8I3AH55_VERLO|nr:hypothetical protein HYQ44_006609 [Verticillium longisporum]KAG7117313.1 hypothetical protein HYQ45_015932 [Verticillium longisporum]
MAPNLPESGRKTANTIQLPYRHEKLPRLAEGSKIQKRAIPRRQQPASSNERLIYVSSSTPFIMMSTTAMIPYSDDPARGPRS